jgi:signal transduction histidine kinase
MRRQVNYTQKSMENSASAKRPDTRFELSFVLSVLLAAIVINYLVPFRLAFLNVYALPVLMAAYSLDLRKTLLGAVACILLVGISVMRAPTQFLATSLMSVYVALFTWGAFLLLSAILVDRLKLKLLEEVARTKKLHLELDALTELDKFKDKFLHSVTHDLKAPLNAIQAYSQLILKGLSGPITEAQQRQIEIIRSSTVDLAKFIDELLDLSKLQAGRMEFDKALIPALDILQPVFDLQRGTAENFKINLTLSVDPALPPVWADKKQISRVVTNLVYNSFKFTPDGGSVELSATASGADELEFQVRDTGLGIPKEKLETVFDQFVQVADTRKMARMAGTGLGLTIVKEIVEAHHGRIWAESELNAGSRFRFTLPLRAPSGELPESAPTAAEPPPLKFEGHA